jgi:hypothetical protein
MRRLRRKVLLAAAALFALGVSFAAEPTAFNERPSASSSRAHWVPGSVLPMSAFEQSEPFLPTPH